MAVVAVPGRRADGAASVTALTDDVSIAPTRR